MSKELIEYNLVYNSVMQKMHTLKDLLNRKIRVMVEGDSGLDVVRARQMGLFTCNVKGIDIIAMCESDAAPLIHYIEQGGTYGSLDFSRLLGYSEQEIAEYKKMLELQAKLKIPNFSSGLQGSSGTALIIGDSHVDSSVLAKTLVEELKLIGLTASAHGIASSSTSDWANKSQVCRPKSLGDKCVDKSSIPKKPDLLLVSLGTNDCATQSPNYGKIIDNFKKIKEEFSPNRMVIIGPPYLSGKYANKYARNENTDPLYEELSKSGLEFFDSRVPTKDLVIAGSGDGVHLGSAGQKAWGKAIGKFLASGSTKSKPWVALVPIAFGLATVGLVLYLLKRKH